MYAPARQSPDKRLASPSQRMPASHTKGCIVNSSSIFFPHSFVTKDLTAKERFFFRTGNSSVFFGRGLIVIQSRVSTSLACGLCGIRPNSWVEWGLHYGKRYQESAPPVHALASLQGVSRDGNTTLPIKKSVSWKTNSISGFMQRVSSVSRDGEHLPPTRHLPPWLKLSMRLRAGRKTENKTKNKKENLA